MLKQENDVERNENKNCYHIYIHYKEGKTKKQKPKKTKRRKMKKKEI